MFNHPLGIEKRARKQIIKKHPEKYLPSLSPGSTSVQHLPSPFLICTFRGIPDPRGSHTGCAPAGCLCPGVGHPQVGTLPTNKHVLLPRPHHQPSPQPRPLPHLLHFISQNASLRISPHKSPFLHSLIFPFCVSSVCPHASPPVSPAPAVTALFSICLSKAAMFWGTVGCFHLLPSQLDQPRAPYSCCPPNTAIGSQCSYLVKHNCAKHLSPELFKVIM